MKIFDLNAKILFTIYLLFITYNSLEAQSRKRANKNKITYPESTYESIKYRSLGPHRGGRSAAVTGVPGNPNLFYFGATGGGVWKTEDGGQSYENISDGYFGGSIGSVAVSKSDKNVIYVGGGEVTLRGNVSSGYGIWKSVDAGKTWNFSGLPKSRHVPRIVIDPNNHNIVYAAVLGNIYKPTSDRGVYKSKDGGKTWKKVLFSNNHSGAVELVMDPSNSRTLYAATWRVNRTPYSLNSGGEGSALWKSIDQGENWTKISINEGFAEGTLGIIGVTVSPVNTQRVWAIVENQDEGGIYRSEDGGSTWSHINDSRALRQRAWYYSKIYADTQDEDIVYVMNVSYHKSKDGGKTFKSNNAPHGDHHDLWIAPEDNQRMIIADDGGAQISFNGGETWTTYHNQPTAQFYRVTTDNSFPFRIYVAQQDNSTLRVNYRSSGGGISEDDWEPTAGGESAHLAIDPLDNDIVYGGSYGGYLTRVNHKTNSERAINVWPDNPMGYGAEGMKYRFQWNFPIHFSRHDPKKLYTFSNHVHVSEDEGQSWEIISPDLTRNAPEKLKSSGGPITQDNTGVEYYCTIFAANESSIKEGLMWVGSDDGLIHLTKDGGNNWENVTPSNMPKWLMINSIEPSPFDPAVCYVAGTLYKTGDFKPYLYKTSDYGKTWSLITNGIKSEHFSRVLRADPERKGILYTGTESGMYISFDDGNSWNSFQLNLPIVPITDLTIKENSLIVATQGRSIWALDDLTVLHQIDQNTVNKDMNLFKPKTSYRTRGRGGKETLTEGTNIPNGVIVHFNLKNFSPDKDELSIHFKEQDGTIIKTYKSNDENDKLEIKSGGNTFVWNTLYEGAEILDSMIFWSASFSGAKAVPGKYKVILEKNGESQEQDFEILPDPRSEVSISQMRLQFDFVNKVNATVDKAHKAIKNIRQIRKKLEEFDSNFSENESVINLVEKAKQLNSSLTEIEKALYQTKNRSRQDPLNFPIKLTNKLGHLNSLVTSNDFPPTNQDELVRKELTAEVENHILKYQKLVSQDLKYFNEEFASLNLDYLTVK
ncbi:MAG: WD40/YVTN/BNR-like repeat-containing protein [Flavobacteriaceae bacterium]